MYDALTGLIETLEVLATFRTKLDYKLVGDITTLSRKALVKAKGGKTE